MKQLAQLANATRGGVLDNVYHGCASVVDAEGQVIFSLGDPDYRAFIRSAAKPLQALALVELGGIEAFGLTDAELAIICASHSGGDLQVQMVRRVLDKIGLDESALHAGGGIEDNCSGKHAGMLALAKLAGHSIEGYFEPDHPIQAIILERVSAMCGLPLEQIDVGIDGCGAPIFAMPLANMALSYCRLSNGDLSSPASAKAISRIARAMQNHPELIGGLDLREICDGKIVAKAGASGCYCAGFCGRNIGFAMKVADGSSEAILPVFSEVARRLDLITEEDFERFTKASPPAVKNRRGEIVGEVRIVF